MRQVDVIAVPILNHHPYTRCIIVVVFMRFFFYFNHSLSVCISRSVVSICLSPPPKCSSFILVSGRAHQKFSFNFQGYKIRQIFYKRYYCSLLHHQNVNAHKIHLKCIVHDTVCWRTKLHTVLALLIALLWTNKKKK